MANNPKVKKASKKKKSSKEAKREARAEAPAVSPQGGNQASLTGEGTPAVAAAEVEAEASRESTPQPSSTPKASKAKVVHENWEALNASLDGRKIILQVPLHLKNNQRRDAFLEENAAVPLFTAAALTDLARQHAHAYEEDALSACLLRTASATAALCAPPSSASPEVASGSLTAQAQRDSVITSALTAIRLVDIEGKKNDPRAIRLWLEDLHRALKRFSGWYTEDDWPKAMCEFALLRLRGAVATVMGTWVDNTDVPTWTMFCDKVLKEFSPLDHQVTTIVSEVLAPCPTAHGGVIATQITQLKAGVLKALGPDVIETLEKENPAFMCAIVRNGLAASYPMGLAKIVKSDHLGKHLAAIAKASEAGDEPAEPTGIQPWRKDLEILQRTVENNAAAKGTCVVAACSTCMGDHPRLRGGKPNCKLPAADGARARGTIREQAANRWRVMDTKAKALSQPQQRQYKQRRDQYINKLAAISDRSVEESDWARPDQAMANSLQSYMSQRPKATGKGSGGGRSGGGKRKSQPSSNELAAAISAAVVLGIREEKNKKKKKKSSGKDE